MEAIENSLQGFFLRAVETFKLKLILVSHCETNFPLKDELGTFTKPAQPFLLYLIKYPQFHLI